MSAFSLRRPPHVVWRPSLRRQSSTQLARCVLLACLLIGGAAANRAMTQERPPGPATGLRIFQIPRQPLAVALQAYSQTSGVDVLYESHVAAGLQSTPVDGAFTPDTALRALLAGTDLSVHYTRSNAITLSLPTDDHLPPLNPLSDADLQLDTLRVSPGTQANGTELREFSEIAQADIETALRKNARTRTGNYRAQVRLWIDAARTVRKAELAQSTGDAERDARITNVLQGLVLRRMPPSNAPQPIRVVIVVRSS